MTSFFLLWSRRLWPYVALVTLVALGMLATALLRGRHDAAALDQTHQVSAMASDTVRIDSIRYVHDTVRVAPAVARYRAKRDTVRLHLTDTVQVKDALSDCDSAIGTLQAALGSAARLIGAHQRYEAALRTELVISERLRAPRYALTSRAGVEWGTTIPVTELESSVRLTPRWSVVGRISKRWVAGEPTRRMVLASYAF